MKFSDWKKIALEKESAVLLAQKVLEDMKRDLDNFTQTTLGFKSGSPATLLGTAGMIANLIEMQKENVEDAEDLTDRQKHDIDSLQRIIDRIKQGHLITKFEVGTKPILKTKRESD